MNTPAQIAANYVAVGKRKANLPLVKMLLLAILAGAFIALAGAAATFGNVYVNKAMGAAISPAGLAMVLIAGSELFTGNCLLVIPLLEKEITAKQMVRNLVVVYLGYLVGGVLVSVCAVYGGTLDAVAETVVATAAAKCNLTFAAGLLRGILCNILVCLGVLMAAVAKDAAGKVVALFFPVAAFIMAGYEHCVANMYYFTAGILAGGEIALTDIIFSNMIAVTLGNIVGGGGGADHHRHAGDQLYALRHERHHLPCYPRDRWI